MSWTDPVGAGKFVGGAFQELNESFFPNAAKAGMPYLEENPAIYHEYYDPYVDWGKQVMPELSGQYENLLKDPSGMRDWLTKDFQTNPGYQFQMDQMMNAGNNAAAAGGMLGTPMHQQQNMGYAQGLANQEFNNYLSQMLGLYGQGLEGTQGMFDTGYNASMGLAGQLGNNNNSMAQLAYSGQNNANKSTGGLMGAIAGMF